MTTRTQPTSDLPAQLTKLASQIREQGPSDQSARLAKTARVLTAVNGVTLLRRTLGRKA